MQANTIQEKHWPLCEHLVTSAVKIIGQLGNEDEKSRKLVREQAELLHAGLGQLLTVKQYRAAARRATKIVEELVTAETDHQMTFFALLCQSAYQYVQPDTLEDVASNLVAVLLTTPLSLTVLKLTDETRPRPRQRIPLTRRDKMLLFVLGFIGSSLSSTMPLHPIVLQQVRGVREFFADQLLHVAEPERSHQAALEATLQVFRAPPVLDIPAIHHWHNLTCAVLAPALVKYDSTQPDSTVDFVVLTALDARLELAKSRRATLN
ncbi:hypothetical protein [Deinococcus fonticola]|uniref:hypothetical protein n=1 Tax=Deinococcus fonticola TaxID=2528713 RepID=UPI0010754BEA|nr:hypothetical protein [Deinococcus fonticola]